MYNNPLVPEPRATGGREEDGERATEGALEREPCSPLVSDRDLGVK